MKNFKMTCSCGDTMTVDAMDRNDAVKKMKAMMTKEAIEKHMSEKHPGDPMISVADCHAMIEKDLVAA